LAAAVVQLRDAVPSISEGLLVAMDLVKSRRKCKTVVLHPELLAALVLYTLEDFMGTGCKFYQLLNVALRSRIFGKTKPYFEYLRMFIDALGHLPIYKGAVYRGISGFDLTGKFPIGKPVRVWEVWSVSKSRNVAESFASRDGKSQQTLCIIETQRVAELGNLSAYPSEEECLFLPGTAFVATKAERVGSRAVIYLTHRVEDVKVLYK
jgi:hypothetical protein